MPLMPANQIFAQLKKSYDPVVISSHTPCNVIFYMSPIRSGFYV